MSPGKCRKWHFQDPKFQNFLGSMPPDPQEGSASGARNTLLVRTPSKSHDTPMTFDPCSLHLFRFYFLQIHFVDFALSET